VVIFEFGFSIFDRGEEPRIFESRSDRKSEIEDRKWR